ncbi:polysaccharide deacetylase family protein [Limnobacter sp.]|uniref:polysaccharide deacetylase family protein n=1 Tax=Limnobacter sp. TaxID=2003368 RepID=UPI002585EE7F|nr:polysaccharide deacetylase family protein [Limnobacter sp.]HEX5484863.1 polysaccharide deacetylase family protein [Limnobacter sp.]
MRKLLALKVDVDTWRGTREGVLPLVNLFNKHGAGATFLFSLGPDHTGRAIKRVFRPGFLSKVSRTSVVEHYGVKTLLYGTLLPGPDIGKREAGLLRQVRNAGFETGIHTWDHIAWQDNVVNKGNEWTSRQMQKAFDRYQEVFGEPPKTHGAAGWQMNEHAYALEKQMGMDYASDGRGSEAFLPCDATGRVIGVPQIPTNLPTLDELIGLNGIEAGNVHETVLACTEKPLPHGHVYTLHSELEGMKLLDVLERLILGWKAQGYELVSTRTLFERLDVQSLPRLRVGMGEIPGRSGQVAVAFAT